MIQSAIVIASFALLPLLTGKCKINSGLAIMICCGLIHLVALRSLDVLWNTVVSVFTLVNINAVVAIVLIGVLSGLMKQYGMLDDIVEPAKQLIRNRKVLMCLIPAVIGFLSVPGGALLSAPFADELGEEMAIPKPRRAAMNLTFRHVAMLLSPFSTFQIYIASRIPINTYLVISLFVPFVALLAIGSVLIYMPGEIALAPKYAGGRKKALRRLFKGLSPILLVLLLTGVLGLPMSVTLLGALALVWAMGNRGDFIGSMLRNVKFDIALIILAVYFAQYTVLALSDIQSLISGAFVQSSTAVMMAVVMGGSLFLGFITGLYYISLSVFLPILLTVSQSAPELPLLFFVCVWSFMGYFYSPLHLCQLLTIRHIGVGQRDVYREHMRLAPWLVAATIALYLFYSLIF
ncbi:MAG: DUF401 family protein [Bacillota bacterium]